MSPGFIKMSLTISAMFVMAISILLIYFSRYKLNGFFKIITAILAYLLLVVAGFLTVIVVLSGF